MPNLECKQWINSRLLGFLLLSFCFSCDQRSGPVAQNPNHLSKPPAFDSEGTVEPKNIFDSLEGVWIPMDESDELYANPDLLRDPDLGFKMKLPFAWYAHKDGFSFLQHLHLKDSYALKRFQPYSWGQWIEGEDKNLKFEFYRDRELQIFLRALMPLCSASNSFVRVSRYRRLDFAVYWQESPVRVKLSWIWGDGEDQYCSRDYWPLPLQEF